MSYEFCLYEKNDEKELTPAGDDCEILYNDEDISMFWCDKDK
jgi:hypothetical protein